MDSQHLSLLVVREKVHTVKAITVGRAGDYGAIDARGDEKERRDGGRLEGGGDHDCGM